MPKLVCQDCGEVLEEDLTQEEAEEARESLEAEDHTHDEQDSGMNDGEGGDGSGSGLDERQDPADVEEEMKEEFEDKLDELNDDEKVEEAAEDVDDYQDAAEAENMNISVQVGGDYRDPGQRWDNCERDSKRIARIFQDKLRQKRKDKTHREQRSGRFDSNRMIQADRGNPRVFKRTDEGDNARYETYFVLDRSYSMRHSEMGPAENATATLMLALEEAGVKTELLDFYNDTPRVIKTKSQDAADEKGSILRGGGAADGGTPLGAVMQVLEDRIEGTDGEPFVIVITDGAPNSQSAYIDAVQGMDAEVMGVTIGTGGSLSQPDIDKMFHEHVHVSNMANLNESLEELARGVML